MKVILYILLGLALLIGGFFTWFFLFFTRISDLDIPENSTETKKIEAIDEWFTALQTDGQFNGAVLFARNGKPVFMKGYGFENAEKTKPITPNTSFRLASVSKQFTATGILVLQEQNKLNIDDEVVQYIEGFPYKNVTIRHLLNHTSGIPDAYMDLATANKESIKILTNEKAIELLMEAKPEMVFQPNERHEYANTNCILLARIIEIVSDSSFETFMQENVFEPLQMKQTRVWNLLSKDENFLNKAEDMRNIKGKLYTINPSFIDGVAGDGAVFSSLNDFLIWDQFWYENNLVSEINLQEAFQKVKLTNGEFSHYGFGWSIGEKGVWHNGAWLGACTIISRNIKDKTLLVVLDNGSNMVFDEVVKKVKPVFDGLEN